MNYKKFLLIFLPLLLVPLGCGEEGAAAVDVLKKRFTNQVQDMIGKGDIAITKYENKIRQVKDSLMKVKVSRKTFEGRLQAKKTEVAREESIEPIDKIKQTKLSLLKTSVQEMETFLQQLQLTEVKLGEIYKKLVANLDIVKLKVANLEAKRDMLAAQRAIQEYSNIGDEVSDIGGSIDSTLEEMQKDIYAIEAEIEVENLLSQANNI